MKLSMTCRQLLRPFDRAHVGVAWMLAAGIISAVVLDAVASVPCLVDVCH